MTLGREYFLTMTLLSQEIFNMAMLRSSITFAVVSLIEDLQRLCVY